MKNEELNVALMFIEMSLTDKVDNPNFESNRRFALRQIEKLKNYHEQLRAKEASTTEDN